MVNHTGLTLTSAHLGLKSNACPSHVGRAFNSMPTFVVQCVHFCVVVRTGEALPIQKLQLRKEARKPLPGIAPLTLLGGRELSSSKCCLKSGLQHACAVSPPRAGLPLLQVPGSVGRASRLHWAPHKMQQSAYANAKAFLETTPRSCCLENNMSQGPYSQCFWKGNLFFPLP